MMKNARVLLLDDEPLVQMVLCSRLEQSGALVVQSRSCAEALNYARKMDVDIAVFDHSLPDGNGVDAVRKLRKEGFGFPVIILSAEAEEVSREAADVDGIFSVEPKPPEPERVVEVVVQALGSRIKQPRIRVGRYAYWKAEPGRTTPPGYVKEEWLGIDISELDETNIHPSLMECLCRTRCGTVVLGAEAAMRRRLNTLQVDIEYVSDVEELEALSRRPTSPSERNAVLLAVGL
ncbi:MAG: response regulator [Pontiellaceae bacterium]|nr:response regulator [Pontiellaceae bacterium]